MPRPVALIHALALAVAVLLSACAARPNRPQAAASTAPTAPGDPFEATNRRVLDFNWKVDDAIYRPAAKFYRKTLGPWTRTRVRNVLRNLQEPSVTANALLQGRPVEAGTSFMRFAVNSTLGLGGLFDLKSIGGPPRQTIDFGQTLYTWSLPDGPYLMLPFAGPFTPRELVGSIGDGLANPLTWALPLGANLGRTVAFGLDEREQNIESLDEIRNNSLDPYARLRSLWRQNRDAELGRATAETPEVLDDPGADAGSGSGRRAGWEGRPKPPLPSAPQAVRRAVWRFRVPTRAPSTAATAPRSIAAKAQ
jgi:phospholipid-binding lipoprotein MlaA